MDQYKLESAGPAPSELAPAIRAALQNDGVKIMASESGSDVRGVVAHRRPLRTSGH